MTRNDIIKQAGTLIDAMRPQIYAADTTAGYALLGAAERFCNRMTDARRTYLITIREAEITLTVLRLRASKLNAYQFRRYPSQRWIARYRDWPIPC